MVSAPTAALMHCTSDAGESVEPWKSQDRFGVVAVRVNPLSLERIQRRGLVPDPRRHRHTPDIVNRTRGAREQALRAVSPAAIAASPASAATRVLCLRRNTLLMSAKRPIAKSAPSRAAPATTSFGSGSAARNPSHARLMR